MIGKDNSNNKRAKERLLIGILLFIQVGLLHSLRFGDVVSAISQCLGLVGIVLIMIGIVGLRKKIK